MVILPKFPVDVIFNMLKRIGFFLWHGACNAAETGTIFLDELGDLCPDAQAAMVRFLQDGEVRTIGFLQAINLDVRVIAATNKNLDKAMGEGRFREDLYDRLNEFSLFCLVGIYKGIAPL